MKRIMLVLPLLACMLLSSCQKTLYIAPRQVDCTGAADRKCYLIRSNPQDNWILHNQEFEGLNYTAGYEYKVKVKRQRLANPPAGGSSYKYLVIEVLEKNQKLSSDVILAAKTWRLNSYGKGSTISGVREGTEITLQFNAEESKVNGTAGCNRYFSGYTVGGNRLEFGVIGSTKMACEEGIMKQEDTYLQLLEAVEKFEVSDDNLTLFTAEEDILIFEGY